MTCSDPTATLFTDAACGAAACVTGTIGPTCSVLKTTAECNVPGTFVYVSMSSSSAMGGGCPPSPEVPTVPPAGWTTNALACAPLGNVMACGAGKECTPMPAAPFDLCIYQAGNVACPAGAYQTKSLIDTNWLDTRTCTACSCDAPGCSGGQVIVSTNAACSSGVNNNVPTTCQFDGIPGFFAYYARVATPPAPTACTPGGGQPTGSAMPMGPVTLCCQ